jgi:hypothetical protein
MTRPYDNIPRAGGAHEKKIDEEHSGMNVRAPKPDADADKSTSERVLQVSVNESTGCYRFSPGSRSGDEGFSSLCEVNLEDGMSSALDQVGDGQFWVVLENGDTGEVFYEADYNLSDNWSDGGRFDVVTLFPSEEDAASYAESRLRAHEE